MARTRTAILAGIALLSAAPLAPATAQKPGGVLKVFFFDSPASMSIHEESTIAGQGPMMGVFNNLVMYDQSVPQSGLKSVVPDLASEWAWDEASTSLTFKLRQGVKWHDGKPFTARDVKCTWDLLQGKGNRDAARQSAQGLVWQPRRRSWSKATDEVTFRLKRKQPAFIALLASGFSPVYPCHVTPLEMRRRPIGTGPYKFVEFKPNEVIRVTRNPDYWKKGRPYLDGIDYKIIKNQSTGVLTFVAGDVDMTSPYFLQVPVLNDIKSQRPQATCQLVPTNVQRNVMINRDALPFNKPELRRAVALTLDRRAFIDTLTQGKGDIGGALLAPPEGIWGMPAELMQKLPGYDPDVAKNRAEARKIMEKAGYGPDKRLKSQGVDARYPALSRPGRDPVRASSSISTSTPSSRSSTPRNGIPSCCRKDYTIGANLTGNGIDDPDQAFYENYACGSESNYDGYCNPEIDKLFDAQSMEADQDKRKKMVWDIERRLAEDVARPVLYHNRSGTCWHPYVKGYTPMVNSIYNGMRMEDVWLDK